MWRVLTWVGVVALLVLVGCGVTEPLRAIPVEEGAVLVGPVGSTPAEPLDSVILCDTVWTAKSLCWQVRDSVRP